MGDDRPLPLLYKAEAAAFEGLRWGRRAWTVDELRIVQEQGGFLDHAGSALSAVEAAMGAGEYPLLQPLTVEMTCLAWLEIPGPADAPVIVEAPR